jgi:hypothetical protein
MSFYNDSEIPVREALAEAHAAQFERFGQAGTWGTAAQRLAVISQARQAGIEAGMLEMPKDGGAVSDVELPEDVRAIIHCLAVSPKDFDMDTYQQARRAGLSDPEFAEMVAIVSFIVNLDVYARGIGVPLRPFVKPQSDNPTRELPVEAVLERAFVPTIPNPPEGGAIAKELYGSFKPYIMRALSIVPDEFRAHLELEQAQYILLPRIMDFDYNHHEGLTRPQVEVVAGRVSAINDCFY